LGIASSAPEDAAAFVAAANALYKAAIEPGAGAIGEKRFMVVAEWRFELRSLRGAAQIFREW